VVELRAFCRALKLPFPTFIKRLHLALRAHERDQAPRGSK
jgi:hypothetical protein